MKDVGELVPTVAAVAAFAQARPDCVTSASFAGTRRIDWPRSSLSSPKRGSRPVRKAMTSLSKAAAHQLGPPSNPMTITVLATFGAILWLTLRPARAYQRGDHRQDAA